MLVLRKGFIYDVCRCGGFMHKFHEDSSSRSSKIKVLPQKFERL
jgi:hypothetical protein